MKKIILFLLISNSAYSNDYEWLKQELKLLSNSYIQYIKKLPLVNKNDIHKLDCDLSIQKPALISLKLPTGENINIPTLNFFQEVNPLGDYYPTNLSISNKLKIANTDLAKLKIFIWLLPNLSELYFDLQEKKNTKNLSYRKLLKASEQKLLEIAKKATTAKSDQIMNLIYQYDYLTLELSKIVFPIPYSFYRRRIKLSIATPDSARKEVHRLESSLQSYH